MGENHRFINSVNLNAGTDFPYLVLEIINEQSFPRNPGFQVMHWHEDIQFIYVLEGRSLGEDSARHHSRAGRGRGFYQ